MEIPDVINQLLNIVAPPLACFTIWLSLSSFRTLKRFLSLITFFFSNEDVAGHVILITGASSGIGEHLAYEYARKGACLVLAARREERGREVAGRCLELGSPYAIFLRTDVSDVADCKLAVDATVAHFGKLDHLVTNAGIVSFDMLEDCDDVNNLRPVMDINFWGSVYITRFAIPHLRRSKGKITVISSASSWLPLPRMGFYNASKAALVAFYEALRIELWPDVKITIATPGFIESEMTQGKYLSQEGLMKVDQEFRDVQVGLVPVGNAGGFAKAVISGACRHRRLVIEPDWIRLTRIWKIVFPEALDWAIRWLYIPNRGSPAREANSKRLLDVLPGARAILHFPPFHAR